MMLHRLEHSDGCRIVSESWRFDSNVQGPLHAADQFGARAAVAMSKAVGDPRSTDFRPPECF